MGDKWAALVGWWQGKKTMVGGVVIVAAAVAAIWFGKIDVTTGAMVAGAGLSVAGFAAKANTSPGGAAHRTAGHSGSGRGCAIGKRGEAVVDIENAAQQMAARRWNPEVFNTKTDPGGDAK